MLPAEDNGFPLAGPSPASRLPRSILGTVAWYFALLSATILAGCLLSAALLSTFVWKWLRLTNALSGSVFGSYLVNDPHAFRAEMSQSFTLFGLMFLAFIGSLLAQLLGRISRRLPNRDLTHGRRAVKLSGLAILVYSLTSGVYIFLPICQILLHYL